MTRTSSNGRQADRPAAPEPSARPTAPAERAWSPAPAPPVPGQGARTDVGARSGGLGIGSPIYEELVAELGDPTS